MTHDRYSRNFDLALTGIAPAIWGSTYIVTTELLPGGYPLTAAVLRALPAGLLLLGAVRFLTLGSSSVLVDGATSNADPTSWRRGADLLLFNVFHLPDLIAGAFGLGYGLGRLETPVPFGIAALTPLTVAALVALALVTFDRRKVVALVVVAACFVVPPLMVLQSGHNVVGEIVQPRYLVPLVPLLIGTVLLTRDGDTRVGLTRRHLVLFAVAAAVVNSVGLYAQLHRYVHGLADPAADLDRDRGWWWDVPLTPMGLWALASATGLVLFLLTFLVNFAARWIIGRSERRMAR